MINDFTWSLIMPSQTKIMTSVTTCPPILRIFHMHLLTWPESRKHHLLIGQKNLTKITFIFIVLLLTQ